MSSDPSLRLQLHQGLANISLDLDDQQVDQLLGYLDLLEKWNKSFNLTAITGRQSMLSYHLLDSLVIHDSIAEHADALDVGSGAGLPGIPLAIAKPHSKWTLLDSNGKKTRFMQQALAHCKIKNATVVKSRVQDYHAADSLDVIISRAYASLVDFTESVAHLMSSKTTMMTMKTSLGEQESQAMADTRLTIQESILQVPGIVEPRSLVTIRQKPNE